MDLITTRASQQENLIAATAEDDIEMVKYIAAKNAQVDYCWIGEGCEIGAHVGRSAIVTRQF